MADPKQPRHEEEREEQEAFEVARKYSAYLLFFVAGVLAVLDATRTDFELNPLVLVPFVIVGAALLGVRANLRNGG